MSTLTVKSGLDNLPDGLFTGRRVGLVTNQTGLDRRYRRTAQVLQEAGADVATYFGPEHGYYGLVQDAIPVGEVAVDRWSGAPVYSLFRPEENDSNPYGPPPGSLDGLDALVFDIQDTGVRFYTYTTTLGILLEQVVLPVYVIDRPNPLGGQVVEGPRMEAAYCSFLGRYPQVPIRHGLTAGELAHFINSKLLNGRAELEVIRMSGWRRSMRWEATGLPWVATSPNLPSPLTARLYPGTCLLEGTNLSVGRGTAQPFELLGAPWLTRPDRLARELNRLERPGLHFRDTFFKPIYFPYQDEVCGGLQVHIRPEAGPDEIVRSGIHIVAALARLYPAEFEWLPEHFDRLAGSNKPRRLITASGGDPVQLECLFEEWLHDEALFREQRQDVLFYD